MRSTRPCFNEEAALTSGFTKKETTAGSIPEAAAAYQEWASKQMELFSRQAKKVFEERRISPRPAARSLAMARGRPVHDRRKAASCDGDQESQLVSAQGVWTCHERRRDCAKFAGSRVRASMMFQPRFLAVEMNERTVAKSMAPCNDRKPPEIFCRSFIMRPSRSA